MKTNCTPPSKKFSIKKRMFLWAQGKRVQLLYFTRQAPLLHSAVKNGNDCKLFFPDQFHNKNKPHYFQFFKAIFFKPSVHWKQELCSSDSWPLISTEMSLYACKNRSLQDTHRLYILTSQMYHKIETPSAYLLKQDTIQQLKLPVTKGWWPSTSTPCGDALGSSWENFMFTKSTTNSSELGFQWFPLKSIVKN